MAKKFKKGAFALQKDVTDLEAFEKPIEAQLHEIIAWADKNEIHLAFGTTEGNTYLCEFHIVAQTASLCKGYVSELRAKLKKLFPKLYLSYEWSGDHFD